MYITYLDHRSQVSLLSGQMALVAGHMPTEASEALLANK